MAKANPKPRVHPPEVDLHGLYRQMFLLKTYEARLIALSREGVLRGSLHLGKGQEALPVGAAAALKPQDNLTMTYRGHGYAICKGIDLGALTAEVLGRQAGLCGGWGGKMHITDPANGLLGANGIVGAGVPVAVGAAMTAYIDGEDRVALTVFGDGSLNQGVVHESLNMAGLWQLPIILMCENNLYAEMTPLTESTAVTDLASRMAAYGIHAVRVDGNDVLAVYEVVKEARARASSGKGPTFIEAFTYRTCGHYQNDPGVGYRTHEEVAEWDAKSPLVRYGAWLLEQELATQADLDKLEEQAEEEVEKAFAFALASPEPDASELEEKGAFA